MSQDYEPFRLFPYQAIVDRPRVAWPNGARVAVWVIPNIEHFHIEIGNQAPDIRNHSRRDYGNRVGVWRIIEVLAKHGIKRTTVAQPAPANGVAEAEEKPKRPPPVVQAKSPN